MATKSLIFDSLPYSEDQGFSSYKLFAAWAEKKGFLTTVLSVAGWVVSQKVDDHVLGTAKKKNTPLGERISKGLSNLEKGNCLH